MSLFEFKSVDDVAAGKLREMLTLHTNPRENFAHKFKASPGHPTGSFTKTNLRKMGDITDKVW